MSPAEYGEHLASLEEPITDEQAEHAAHILVSAERLKAQAAA